MNRMRQVCTFMALSLALSVDAQHTLSNPEGTVKAAIDKSGHLSELQLLAVDGRAKPIGFRSDGHAGPALLANGMVLAFDEEAGGESFQGRNDSLDYVLQYRTSGNGLELIVSCKAKRALADLQLSFQLGLDTDMDHYPQWHHVYFPTMMRCEKTHFWGYLMSPLGRIVTVSSPDPVASYHLHYNNDRQLHSFGHGHRIRTVSLDLVNPAPLPQRHPALYKLARGEKRTWRIFIDEVANLADVSVVTARRTQAAVPQADFYTVAPGETSHISFMAAQSPKIVLTTPDGRTERLKASSVRKGCYAVSVTPAKPGMYTLRATHGKQVSEMKLTCRAPHYSDYLKAARTASVRYPQKATSHTESWYGFFPAYKARELFPEKSIDQSVDSLFNAVYPLMYDPSTNRPTAFGDRIQNHAMMAALHAGRYRATGQIECLCQAADLADYIVYKQSKDGAYRSGKTHYTSVIYVAKAVMEVMAEEKKLADKGMKEWQYKYNKHYSSVKMAMDDLASHLDNIETEGEMTFEDGMISCSYTQLSEFALLHPEGSPERARYTQAAVTLADMHRCLSQLVVPDSRMHGGSMRYWEAQYDILTFPDMMNSPHGWSAWRIYGLRNLYLLTGRYEYLRQMTNAIGTCIQLINPETAELNWAFVCDPYIKAGVFEADPDKPGKGKYAYKVIGEQYMPMISGWYHTVPGKWSTGYWGYDGGCCDNDVHEIFKCLGEVLLTSAYVHQQPDGSFTAVNCRAQLQGGKLNIVPAEGCIDRVYVVLAEDIPVTLGGGTGVRTVSLQKRFSSR